MTKLKIIKIGLTVIFIGIIVLVLGYMIFDDSGSEDLDIYIEESPENRLAVLKNPEINLGGTILKAEEMEVYKDDENPEFEKNTFKNFTLTIKKESYDLIISGNNAFSLKRGFSNPRYDITMDGGVKCWTTSGWFIDSDKFIYHNNGALSSEGEARFGNDTVDGRADKFIYNPENGYISFLQNVKIRFKDSADSALPGAEINTEFLRYNLDTGDFNTTGGISIRRGDEYITGKRMNGESWENSKKIKHVEIVQETKLFFKSLSAQGDNSDKKEKQGLIDFSGYKLITSPNVELNFLDDDNNTLSSLTTAKPSKLLVLDNPSDKKAPIEIVADTFLMTFREDALAMSGFEAHNNFKLTQEIVPEDSSRKPYQREIEATHFFSELSEQDGSIQNARFEKNVKIKELSINAEADAGLYDAGKGLLILNKNPQLRMERGVTAAVNAEYNVEESILYLKGSVVSKLVKDDKNAVFDENQDIYINANEMTHRSADNLSQYKGNVQVYQDKSYIFSGLLDITGDETYIAKENVRGKIVSTEEDATQSEMVFSGEETTINNTESLIIIEKKAKVKRAVDENLNAEYIEYKFQDKVNTPVYMKAKKDVSFKRLDYSGVSSSFYYDYPKDLITLKGPGLILYKVGKPVAKSHELTFSPSGDIIQGTGSKQQRIEAVLIPDTKKK